MTGLEIVLIVAVIWLAGALLVVMVEETYRPDELVALTFWFLVVPIGLTWKSYRRWAYTCRDCKRWYGDRAHYDLHLRVRTHCTVPPPGETPEKEAA